MVPRSHSRAMVSELRNAPTTAITMATTPGTMFAMLSNYLDRELDPALCPKLEAHLEDCKPCVGYLASLEETVRRSKRHRTQPIDPKVAAQIKKKLLRVFATASRA
jgi:anti-sigma factor RsiW